MLEISRFFIAINKILEGDIEAVNGCFRAGLAEQPGSMALVDAGHEQRVLMSHDLALQHWQRQYGGHGWQHIPETVTALMRYKGCDEALIQRILVDNPRELLTIQ